MNIRMLFVLSSVVVCTALKSVQQSSSQSGVENLVSQIRGCLHDMQKGSACQVSLHVLPTEDIFTESNSHNNIGEIWHNDLPLTKAQPVNQNTIFNSKLDVISSDLDVYYTELNDNDTKMFSVLERIDTKLVVGVNSIHEKLGMRSIDQYRVSPLQKTICIKQQHIDSVDGFVIAHPGCYKLSETVSVLSGVGIVIRSDNVYLDLGEYTITNLNESTIALQVEHAKNVIIKNGTLIGGKGIEITDTECITLENIQVTSSTASGIELQRVNNFSVTTCSIYASLRHGMVIGESVTNGIIQDIIVADCTESGLVLNGSRIVVEDSAIQHNGLHGVAVQAAHDIQICRMSVEANSINGIMVDTLSERIQVESCRALGNGNIGCVDEGATQTVWVNNLSSGNKVDDYTNIRAVSMSKATSYWHNVYGS